MRVKIDTLERERDFYFDKLREIEILCQNKDVASTPVSFRITQGAWTMYCSQDPCFGQHYAEQSVTNDSDLQHGMLDT